MHTKQSYPRDTPDAPRLESFSQSIRTVNLQSNNRWNTSHRKDLKGSFHGTRHELAIVVFTDVEHLIADGAVLYARCLS